MAEGVSTVYQCANCKELFADLMSIFTQVLRYVKNDDAHEIRSFLLMKWNKKVKIPNNEKIRV